MTVYNATGIDADFIEREQIGRAQAAVFAMREDSKNHYAATLARVHGVRFTIAIVHEPISTRSTSCRASTSRSTRGRSPPRRSCASRTIRGRSRWR